MCTCVGKGGVRINPGLSRKHRPKEGYANEIQDVSIFFPGFVLLYLHLVRFSSHDPGCGGCSRGADDGAVHEGGVVVVLHQVAFLTPLVTGLGPEGGGDLHRVRGVVEVHHGDVEHQHR